MNQQECSVECCNRPAGTRGYCHGHYVRMLKGKPLDTPLEFRATTLAEALAHRTTSIGGCLVWTGATNSTGYAQINLGNRRELVHRLVFQDSHGPIPEGIYIDHRCGNPSCVDVRHLRLATPKQNVEHQTKLLSTNTSGYRGVYRKRNRWMVRVEHNGKRYDLYSFVTAEEANEAAVALRNQLYTHNDRDRIGVAA